MRGAFGPSGAGKSSLLALIDGRLRHWQGEAKILERDLSPQRPPRREARVETGFIFQEFALVDRLTAYQNVMSGRLGRVGVLSSLLSRFSARDHMAVAAALRDTGLNEYAGRRVDQLSGGQRQRVAIARCLAQQPRLLLADEPVSNLDPAHAEKVLALITGTARREGMTTLFSSHQPELSRRFADRVIGLKEGKVLFDLPSGQLSEEHTNLLYHGTPVAAGLRVVS